MSAYKQLIEASNDFEQQLNTIRSELFSTNIGEDFEDRISKKMQNLAFLTSKQRLLKAKELVATGQVAQQPTTTTVQEYGDIASWKVLEQCLVKSVTQADAVKSLVTTPDTELDPEMVERKVKIIEALKLYRLQETELRHLKSVHAQKEDELASLREAWDKECSALRDAREKRQEQEMDEDPGPLHKKLNTTVNKLELMRWMLCKLVATRGACDWLAAPERTARLLALTRERHTVDNYMNSDS